MKAPAPAKGERQERCKAQRKSFITNQRAKDNCRGKPNRQLPPVQKYCEPINHGGNTGDVETVLQSSEDYPNYVQEKGGQDSAHCQNPCSHRIIDKFQMREESSDDLQGSEESEDVDYQRQVGVDRGSRCRNQQERKEDGGRRGGVLTCIDAVISVTYLVAQCEMNVGIIEGISEHAMVDLGDR